MSIAATSGVPCSFAAGDTVRFEITNADYPPSAWSLAFVLNNGVAAAVSTAATESGSTYTVTIAAATTATLAPGEWPWALVYTETATSERVTDCAGTLTVTPNPTATATPSFAQTQVALLETVLAEFNATTRTTVSFNGQSFSRASIGDYRNQYTFWKAAVYREEAKLAAQRGELTSNVVVPSFMPINQ